MLPTSASRWALSVGRCPRCGSRLPRWTPDDHECSTTSPGSPDYDPTVGACAEPGFFVLDGRGYWMLRDALVR